MKINLIQLLDYVDGENLGLLMTAHATDSIEQLFGEYREEWRNRADEDGYLSVDDFCAFLKGKGIEAERVFAEEIIV